MLVVLPFHQGDVARAIEWAEWCASLGPYPRDELLLVADGETQWSSVLRIREVTKLIFREVHLAIADHVEGWPDGPNKLWLEAAKWAMQNGSPFLWVEPDAIPLKQGWTNQIEAAYAACGKPFMGHIYDWGSRKIMSGIAVYPHDAHNLIAPSIQQGVAFDVAAPETIIPMVAHTGLIYHFWGPRRDFPPTFEAVKTAASPENAFTLDKIPSEAVIHHRNKDGTLISLLRDKLFPNIPAEQELLYVFPFCWMDAELLLRNLIWLQTLCGKIPRGAVLHTDSTCSPETQARITGVCSQIFKSVHVSRYTQNHAFNGWPAACNWAFQQAVERMRIFNRSFFWMEADAVAIKKDWYIQLEREYANGGKPFMGPIIGDFDGLAMGHFNGGAVYPPNVAAYSKAILSCHRQAWDTAFRDEIGRDGIAAVCHPANHLMQHCAAVVNGCCKPANGPLPQFDTQADVESIVIKTAVIFHPAKDRRLADRLTERYT